MTNKGRREKAAAIRRLLQTEGAAVAENTRGFNAGRYASTAKLDGYEALKDRARSLKEKAIRDLPELIDRLTKSIESRGGHVYIAEDADAANRYIGRLINSDERLVKSKSMTSEEIGINEYLAARGVEVVETDLGEWVLQIAQETPSHIVAPALHKSRSEIARLFNETFAPDPPLETAEELTRFARNRLGNLIKGADVGMTGANFLVAETGTVVLVTSEGNARKSVFVPPTYIAVAGVEKIIPSIEDAQPFIELLGRSGTGQDITSYVSLFNPPFRSRIPDFKTGTTGSADRSFHLVLIDNGRLAMRGDPDLRETLFCIRCSACANTCANFQSVGGHAFGGETYSGGIATGWETGIHGPQAAESFNDLCTGCSRCVPACPVKIDIPWINTVVRDRLRRRTDQTFSWLADGLRPDLVTGGGDLQKRLFANFRSLALAGSIGAPVTNWLTDTPPVRAALEYIFGVDRRRQLPEFQRQTLRKWFRHRDGPTADDAADAVLFVDPYTNYVHVDRGKSAVRALEALGLSVELSPVLESGRAPLSQGMIDRARRSADTVWKTLVPHLEVGRPIICIEPTDLAMLKRDYERLLPAEEYSMLAENSREILAYIGDRLDAGADNRQLAEGSNRKVAYHAHCQQRTLQLESATVAVLERLGYDVETSNVECCGMAGSFGYKLEYYELSMDVGKQLKNQFSDAARSNHVLAASGTSCLEQLHALLDAPVRHPVELVSC